MFRSNRTEPRTEVDPEAEQDEEVGGQRSQRGRPPCCTDRHIFQVVLVSEEITEC